MNRAHSSIFRLQTSDGRGPWRPGLPAVWRSENAIERPAIPVKKLWKVVVAAMKRGNRRGHIGFGCTSLKGLCEWFQPEELATLEYLGFEPVEVDRCEVLIATRFDVCFWRSEPLCKPKRRISFKELIDARET